MSETYSAELYRQEGDNFRAVRLSVYADGSVRLDAQDMARSLRKYGVMMITSSGSMFQLQHCIN